DRSLQMGARFRADALHYVFSRRPPPTSVPPGVHFVPEPVRVFAEPPPPPPPPTPCPPGVHSVPEPIRAFAEHLRARPGKNVWMMGGGEIIGSFLDEGAIDEFIITVVPVFIGEGIPLLAPRHRSEEHR